MSGYADNALVHRAGHTSDIVFLPKPFTPGGLLAGCGRLSTDETTSRRLRGSARNVTCNLDSSRTSINTWYGFGEGPIVQSTDPNLASTGSSHMSRIAH